MGEVVIQDPCSQVEAIERSGGQAALEYKYRDASGGNVTTLVPILYCGQVWVMVLAGGRCIWHRWEDLSKDSGITIAQIDND